MWSYQKSNSRENIKRKKNIKLTLTTGNIGYKLYWINFLFWYIMKKEKLIYNQ